jgi:hypothetical protein
MEPLFTFTVVFAEIIFSILVLIVLSNNGARKPLVVTIGILWASWLAGVFTMLANGFFTATHIPQIAFAIALATPVLCGLLAQKYYRPFNKVINNVSTTRFLALQQFRIVFGILFFFTASIPAWFQLIGGLGDISAGIGAVLALGYLRKHPERENQAIIRGNLMGILDFIVVLNLGLFVVLKTESPDNMFDLIPLYVVPIFILLHIFSLQSLRWSNNKQIDNTIVISHESV